MKQILFRGWSGSYFHLTCGNILHGQVVHWLVLVVILVDELIVKGMEQLWAHYFTGQLSKGLSNTNSGSTQEWSIAVGVPFVSIRSQKVRTRWIKPFWNELSRFIPLIWILLHVSQINKHLSSLFDIVRPYHAVLSQSNTRSEHHGWFNSERFIEAIAIVVQVLNLIIKGVLAVLEYFLLILLSKFV